MPTVPNPVAAWARSRAGGEITEVRDVSRQRAGARVWELTRADAARFFLKVAPTPDRYSRETHAYRHAVPALGHAHAPVLVDSDPGRLALLLTAAPGAGVSDAAPGRADRTEVYRQAGGLLRRLHDACGPGGAAGPVGGVDRWAAERHAAAEAQVAELSDAGVLDAAERQFILDRAAVLHLLPPLPAGFLHGDVGAHHFLWDAAGRRLALAGFAQARLGCAAEDLVRVAYGACLRDPGLRAAFLRGYGRELTDVERYALPALAALDAAETWARGVRTGDEDAVGRARGVVGALMDGVGLRV
ncbi:aminoglycoside phosphotransferase family protein [Streptomyces chrestomyceticus]|uniref:aminoglycoside phosphotransferase family protein n=1 Tax=Streptomyces chrestomyceticus TaxID=68185 RepID=UPI0019CFE514|nr:aminoglycoside phosphotransferase family protein [Streptomyces chrestomyceticus]